MTHDKHKGGGEDITNEELAQAIKDGFDEVHKQMTYNFGQTNREIASLKGEVAEVQDGIERVEKLSSDTYDLLSNRMRRVEDHVGLPPQDVAVQ